MRVGDVTHGAGWSAGAERTRRLRARRRARPRLSPLRAEMADPARSGIERTPVLRGERAGAHAEPAGARGALGLQRPATASRQAVPVSAPSRPAASGQRHPWCSIAASDADDRLQVQVLGVGGVARGGRRRPTAVSRRRAAGLSLRSRGRLPAAAAGEGARQAARVVARGATGRQRGARAAGAVGRRGAGAGAAQHAARAADARATGRRAARHAAGRHRRRCRALPALPRHGAGAPSRAVRPAAASARRHRPAAPALPPRRPPRARRRRRRAGGAGARPPGLLDVVEGVRGCVRAPGAGAPGPRGVGVGAGAAQEARVALRGRAARLASRRQRGRAPGRAARHLQPRLPRDAVPRHEARGGGGAAGAGGRRRAASHRLQRARGGRRSPAPCEASDARAGDGRLVRAAAGPLRRGAAHAARAHRRRLPAAHPQRRARRRPGGERGQRAVAHRRRGAGGRAARHVGEAEGRGGVAGRAASAQGAGLLGGAVPRAGGAARRGTVRTSARLGAGGAGGAGGAVARRLRLVRRQTMRRRQQLPDARAAGRERRARLQQGGGGRGVAMGRGAPLAAGQLPRGGGEPASRARSIPPPRSQPEERPAVVGRDDPDDYLLVTSRRVASLRHRTTLL